MFSLMQSVRAAGQAGEPLPVVWRALGDLGWTPRKGQMALIVAGPGTGKSAFALNYAVKSSVPALYVSADSDAHTQLSRAIAIATGMSYRDAVKLALSKDLSTVEAVMSGLPLRLVYDGSPNLDRLEAVMAAYDEVYGCYPDLVIVDNVSNVRTEGAGEDEGRIGNSALLDFLHSMARDTESAVFALHHVTGPYNNADKPIPLDGVKGQITDVPEVVLSIHKRPGDDFGGQDRIGVSVIKNRGGKADASGQTFAELQFRGDMMSISDTEE